jgi:hypothetical protein
MRRLIPLAVLAVVLAFAAVTFSAGANPGFTFSTDEPGATWQCSLDGAAPTTCSSAQSYSALTPGQRTVAMTATFTVAQPPSDTYTGPTAISGIANLTATTTRPNVVAMTWLLDGKAVGTSSVSPYTFDANAALLPAGSHTMTVQSVDQDGNRTTSPGVAVTVSTAAPAGAIHLAGGVHSALTLQPGVTYYAAGSPTTLGNITMASNSRLENVTINGTVTAHGATGARLQGVTLNYSGSSGEAISPTGSDGFSLQDSTVECSDANGTTDGAYNGNFEGAGNNEIYARNQIKDCGGAGLSLVTPAVDDTTHLTKLLVLDNSITGVNGPVLDGTNSQGLILGSFQGNVIGNTVVGGNTASIEPFRSATSMHYAFNTVGGSPTGFYLEHFADSSTFEHNTVQATSHGFNVEWVAGTSPPRSTVNAKIVNNAITAPVGVFADAGSSGIEAGSNTIHTSSLPSIVYRGSVNGSIHDNVTCTAATGNPVSVYANAGYDPTAPGSLTTQSNNTVGPSCP